MGREIRMVPPNWDHPRDARGEYKPMLRGRFEDEARGWKEGFAKWEAGLRPGFDPETKDEVWQPKAGWSYADIYADQPDQEWWEYHGGPPSDREMYRPWADAEATWVQVWETVSEGTPVTPPFATRAELVDYLAAHGDFWDQARRREGRGSGFDNGPWKRENAEKFVTAGWAPSLMIERTATSVTISGPRDGGL